MQIEVKIAGTDELNNWDTIIEASPDGTIFHTLDWLKITEKNTNSKLYPLIAFNNEEIVAAFPIFYKKIGPLKTVFSPLPKVATPYLGPVTTKKDIQNINIHAELNKWIHTQIKPQYIRVHSKEIDYRPFKQLGYHVEPLYNYTLDISVGISKLLSEFSLSARKNVKKIEKEGSYKFSIGSKKDMKTIIHLLQDAYAKKKKALPISIKYLADMYDRFSPENLTIFTLKHQDDIVSGCIALCYKDRIIEWIGETKTSSRGSIDFLKYEIMKWATEHKYRYYEMVGANTQSICKFKSKFNPSMNVYFELKKATTFGSIAERIYSFSLLDRREK